MSEVGELTCRQPGCGGPASGVCIENFSFEECPNLLPALSIDTGANDADEGASEDNEPPQDLIRTGNVASLDALRCDALLRERHSHVIGLVAAPEVGKTTLMATLYELVRRGRLEGYGFAGSETVRGFEERCFLSRTSSNGLKPNTLHTPARVGLNFTHMRVAKATGFEDVVISDRSGEHFQRVLDTPSAVADFAELARATAILLLVDGEQLLLSRHRPISEARRLFMALVQAGLTANRPVVLVATKRDLVPEERLDDFEQVLFDLRADLQARAPNASIRSYATGARPRQGSEFGEGFENLIAALLPDRPVRTFQSFVPCYDGDRPFERLVDVLKPEGRS